MTGLPLSKNKTVNVHSGDVLLKTYYCETSFVISNKIYFKRQLLAWLVLPRSDWCCLVCSTAFAAKFCLNAEHLKTWTQPASFIQQTETKILALAVCCGGDRWSDEKSLDVWEFGSEEMWQDGEEKGSFSKLYWHTQDLGCLHLQTLFCLHWKTVTRVFKSKKKEKWVKK